METDDIFRTQYCTLNSYEFCKKSVLATKFCRHTLGKQYFSLPSFPNICTAFTYTTVYIHLYIYIIYIVYEKYR